MFNEAFWFFYLVSFCDKAGFLFGALALVIAFISVMGAAYFHDEYAGDNQKLGAKLLKIGMPAAVLFMFMSLFMPPKEAFYAGAGQYVVEATEIDGTIMQLKEILDQKIAEELENGTADD